ncbi:AbrB/MazE/SpoVT family DNA-binding domain-containing protein [Neisseria gonorrhoeae]
MLRLQKWGNSAAVRLTALNAKIGDALETEIRNGELLIRPVKRYRLSDLLAETEAAPPRAEGWEEMPDVGQEGV